MRELSDRAEEILERLWILVQEQDEQGDVALLSEQDELRTLRELDLVRVEGTRAVLTPDGRREAEKCVRRHRLAERLLADILDTEPEELHAASCKFEHALHRGLEQKVCTMLGHPRSCPHGKPIPPGECCRLLEKEPGQILTSLAELQKGEPAVVAYLHSDEVSDLRKLMAIGVLPGTQVAVAQRFPSYLIEVGNSRFAIDQELAEKIHVRRSA